MDHSSYRRALLADPHEDEQMRAHREACAECAAYAAGVLRFESRLKLALRLEMRAIDGSPAPKPMRSALTWTSKRGYALAASLLVFIAAGGAWLGLPRSTLAAAVVGHMAGEVDAWQSRGAVSGPALEAVLRNASLHLRDRAGVISYANSCQFRGHLVPHLVVQSPAGPVTVMILVHETVGRQQEFDEHGYRGVIMPVAGHGSIAILMRRADARNNDVEGFAAEMRDAMVWSRT